MLWLWSLKFWIQRTNPDREQYRSDKVRLLTFAIKRSQQNNHNTNLQYELKSNLRHVINDDDSERTSSLSVPNLNEVNYNKCLLNLNYLHVECFSDANLFDEHAVTPKDDGDLPLQLITICQWSASMRWHCKPDITHVHRPMRVEIGPKHRRPSL